MLRCREVSPTYCPVEMRGDNADDVIQQANAHGKAAKRLTDDTVNPAMLGPWKGAHPQRT